MEDFTKKLKEYFDTTPREEVLKEWEKSSEYANIGPTVEEYMRYLNDRTEYRKDEYWVTTPLMLLSMIVEIFYMCLFFITSVWMSNGIPDGFDTFIIFIHICIAYFFLYVIMEIHLKAICYMVKSYLRNKLFNIYLTLLGK